MKKVWLSLFLLMALGTPAQAAPEPTIRVGITTEYPRHIRVLNPNGALHISAPGCEQAFAAGKAVEISVVGNNLAARFRGRDLLQARKLSFTGATLQAGDLPQRAYDGTLTASVQGGNIRFINELPLERYVECAVADEIEDKWPLEAIKCQAVIMRSFVLTHQGRHRQAGYDLCDLTHCQRYRGKGHNSLIQKAVLATKGQVLSYRNHPAEALYHATCGGSRAANQWIFGGEALAYLKEGSDLEKGVALCRESPHSTWKVSYTGDEIAKALNLPAIKAIRLERTPTGYVRKVRVEGPKAKAMDGYAFWTTVGPAFGWGEIKSLNFNVKQEKDRYVFSGQGMGHGVGLCQWGARKLANLGYSYRKILARYYPGTTLVPIETLESHP